MPYQIAEYLPNCIYTMDEILQLQDMILVDDDRKKALSVAKAILSNAPSKSISDCTDDVYAMERLVIELESQIRDPDNADSNPILDILSDCIRILEE